MTTTTGFGTTVAQKRIVRTVLLWMRNVVDMRTGATFLVSRYVSLNFVCCILCICIMVLSRYFLVVMSMFDCCILSTISNFDRVS